MVLVHDDDLKCIENAVPPLETLQPDALMGFLRDYAPTIRQFQCGEYYYNYKGPFLMEYTQEFSPGNDNNAEAEGAVATVATLSQNAFEAPRNEGDISPSNWTSNATLSGYVTPTEELEGLEAQPQNKSLSYPAPDDESFGRSGQTRKPTSVEVPKMDPTPGLPSPNPHAPRFHVSFHKRADKVLKDAKVAFPCDLSYHISISYYFLRRHYWKELLNLSNREHHRRLVSLIFQLLNLSNRAHHRRLVSLIFHLPYSTRT